MSTFILKFADIDRSSLALVGGKGANLGEMTKAGFPVPEGFCVTTAGYREFVREKAEDVYQALAGLDPEDLDHLREVGATVRNMLGTLPLPANVTSAVVTAWQALGPEHAYAVRSSATAEDLPSASFAGQQDTYLNIISKEALLERVKQCFISLFTDRAILYRVKNGFPHEQVALSVVVQRMVQPEVSGILFTADPISEHRQIVSIDASFGLGEALVSGLVSADLYKVDKRDWQIVTKEISDKKIAIYSVEGGDTIKVDLPHARQREQALGDDDILDLARLAVRIEAHYGSPQDIEWALENGKIYITQSRPITSLFPLALNGAQDGALHTFMSLSHLQVMTDPMPPLAVSVWKQMPAIARDEHGNYRYLYGVAGRLYADVSPFLRHPIGHKILTNFLSIADRIVQAAALEVAQRPEFLAKGVRYNPLRLLKYLFPLIARVPGNLFFVRTEPAITRSNARISDYVEKSRQALSDKALPLSEKLDLSLHYLRGFFPVASYWLPKFAAGMLAQRALYRLVGEENFGLATDLERGLTGNVVTEMNLAIGDLADLARASGELCTKLSEQNVTPQERLLRAQSLDGGAEFTRAWHDFLDQFGARGPSEIDISRPSWSEDPASLLQMVVSLTAQEAVGAHRQHFNGLIAQSAAAAMALPERVGWGKRLIVRRFIKVSRDLFPMREHHKFLMVRLLAEVKKVVWEISDALHANGVIDHKDDIWFLTVPELRAALVEPVDMNEVISKRRAEFELDKRRTPPRMMTSDGEILRPKLNLEGAPQGALIGSAVSAGIHEGVAKVVTDPAAQSLAPGEILVAHFTDPGWTPLFVNAGALVTEVGGLMTHGSVVAREYGIPAVVGLVDAMALIRTGDVIRVNGEMGYVEILERASS